MRRGQHLPIPINAHIYVIDVGVHTCHCALRSVCPVGDSLGSAGHGENSIRDSAANLSIESWSEFPLFFFLADAGRSPPNGTRQGDTKIHEERAAPSNTHQRATHIYVIDVGTNSYRCFLHYLPRAPLDPSVIGTNGTQHGGTERTAPSNTHHRAAHIYVIDVGTNSCRCRLHSIYSVGDTLWCWA